MKNLFSVLIILATTNIVSTGQSNSSCCQASSIKAFTDLANDLSFVMSHEEPVPFKLKEPKGQDITFLVDVGESGKGYYIKPKTKSNKWIFVFQEWWGLNDYIRLQADNLSDSLTDVHVLAIDLYDGKVATTREEASTYMQGASPERIEKLIVSASDFSGANSRIGTIGWCFGGAWSNKSAALLSNKVTACVMYYGMPIKDESQIKQITAPVLGIFADKDGWITPKVVSEFKNLMYKNGKSIETYGYNNDHAFANPSNPVYDKENAEDAWKKSITFFRKNL